MEKFGIFELLDALSAITGQETPPSDREHDSKSERPSPRDSAYLPPDYSAFPNPNAAANSAPPEKNGTPDRPAPDENDLKTREPRAEADALAGFYARHEAIKRKADKNNR